MLKLIASFVLLLYLSKGFPLFYLPFSGRYLDTHYRILDDSVVSFESMQSLPARQMKKKKRAEGFYGEPMIIMIYE